MGESHSLALLSPSKQVPGMVRPQFLLFLLFLPPKLCLHVGVISIGSIIERLHSGLHQIKCPRLGLLRHLGCPHCLKFQVKAILLNIEKGFGSRARGSSTALAAFTLATPLFILASIAFLSAFFSFAFEL